MSSEYQAIKAASRSLLAAGVTVEKALSMPNLTSNALRPTPGKKADLRYFNKIRVWRIQQSFQYLEGKVPDDKLRGRNGFLENTANGYPVDMFEEDRSKPWAKTEEEIFEALANPHTAHLWGAMLNYVKQYGSLAGSLRDVARKLLVGKSTMQLLDIGFRSGVLSEFELDKAIQRVRDVDSLSEDTLQRLVKALK